MKIPYWLLSGILYGLSWPIFQEINLSFLAWFAFVPLFVFLEKNKEKFLKSMLGCYTSMVVFGCFSAGWLFNFPQMKLEIAVIFFLEELWFFVPFLIFFFIQRKIKFSKAIWLFPFVWMLWEWIYLRFEFTMGTHLSAYSQSNNLWLIQYIDITGMWGVSFWMMFFNVLIFKAYASAGYNIKDRQFYKKVGVISLLMLGGPLVYAGFSYAQYNQLNGKVIQVTVIPTQYKAAFLNNPKNNIRVVEETLYRTDSIAFDLLDKKKHSDLYLWPETGLPFTMQETNLSNLLFEAVNDWNAAILTGAKGVVDKSNINDERTYVSGVLISHQNKQAIYHHKTVLTPGQEAIPYHKTLSKIPGFPIKETDIRFFKKGQESQPLKLITSHNQEFKLGVSLCYEQWYPEHWATLSRNGTDFFTHIAGEGWYGKVGFMKFMTNVTRMRCIENRKQVVRAANIGLSGFIDQLGRYHHFSKKGSMQITTAPLKASSKTTAYAKKPNYFPLSMLVIFLFLWLLQLYHYSYYKLLKQKTIL